MGWLDPGEHGWTNRYELGLQALDAAQVLTRDGASQKSAQAGVLHGLSIRRLFVSVKLASGHLYTGLEIWYKIKTLL